MTPQYVEESDVRSEDAVPTQIYHCYLDHEVARPFEPYLLMQRPGPGQLYKPLIYAYTEVAAAIRGPSAAAAGPVAGAAHTGEA